MEDQQQWKLVPVEPTEEMIRAGERSEGRSTMTNMESHVLIYRDMLAASPSSSVLERARDNLRELIDCASPHDPHKGRSNAGRWVTINAPRELVDRARSALAEIDRALGGGNG